MTYDNHIENDEHHPNPRVAAKYADHNSRIASLKAVRTEVRRLEATADRSAYESNRLDDMRQRVADLVAHIEEMEDE